MKFLNVIFHNKLERLLVLEKMLRMGGQVVSEINCNCGRWWANSNYIFEHKSRATPNDTGWTNMTCKEFMSYETS